MTSKPISAMTTRECHDWADKLGSAITSEENYGIRVAWWGTDDGEADFIDCDPLDDWEQAALRALADHLGRLDDDDCIEVNDEDEGPRLPMEGDPE